MWSFRAEDDGYVTELDGGERAVLAELVDEVVALLGGEIEPEVGLGLQLGGGPVTPPDDVAVRRLLPDGSHDAELAAEFRRLTEADLRVTKVTQLLRLRSALGTAGLDDPAGPAPEEASVVVAVGREEAPSIAAALNDLRLVLAERLGIKSEVEAEALQRLALLTEPVDPEDADEATVRFLATVSTMLGILQESLIQLMLKDVGRGRASH